MRCLLEEARFSLESSGGSRSMLRLEIQQLFTPREPRRSSYLLLCGNAHGRGATSITATESFLQSLCNYPITSVCREARLTGGRQGSHCTQLKSLRRSVTDRSPSVLPAPLAAKLNENFQRTQLPCNNRKLCPKAWPPGDIRKSEGCGRKFFKETLGTEECSSVVECTWCT